MTSPAVFSNAFHLAVSHVPVIEVALRDLGLPTRGSPLP
jgi:hypothetical protein